MAPEIRSAAPLTHTPEEAATIIGGNCKASWLRDKARRREIPCTMIGNSYSFTDGDIAAIVKQFARPVQPPGTKPSRQPRQPEPGPAPSPVTGRSVRVLRSKVPPRMQDVA